MPLTAGSRVDGEAILSLPSSGLVCLLSECDGEVTAALLSRCVCEFGIGIPFTYSGETESFFL